MIKKTLITKLVHAKLMLDLYQTLKYLPIYANIMKVGESKETHCTYIGNRKARRISSFRPK